MTIHRLVIDTAGPHKQGLRTDDAEVAARWAIEAPANAKENGHQVEPVVIHFEPALGAEHAHAVIRSVHRLHADVVRKADGSIEVRNLYHYPDIEPGQEPRSLADMSTQHPLLTKRQWAKIPTAISKRHWVVPQEKKS